MNSREAVQIAAKRPEQEEKTQKLPSDTKKDEQKVHQIRIAKTYFDDVANGIKTFELRKNDRNYKTGVLPDVQILCI